MTDPGTEPGTARHILVCEDSDFIRRVIRTTLEKGGFRVTDAPDGEEARKLLGTIAPDLILSDYNMPNLNGLELLKIVRGSSSSVPVVILSSETSRSLMDEAVAAGASAWLTKPFQTTELLDTIQNILNNANMAKTGGSDS